jgi:tripartite-type tricarboxylate transporter receptor subunit TctC
MKRRALGGLVLAGLATAAAGRAARAQAWPSRPIRMISPFPPGGGTDLLARALCARLAELNGWSVVVENRAGANGTIGLAEAARANPAGYDLVLGQQDNMILSPLLIKVPFDPVRDFTPIAFAGTTPLLILASAASPYRSFADLATAAKAAKGTLTFGSSGSGSNSHIVAELLARRAGVPMQHVPYRGSNPALTDLVGGHVTAVGSSIASAMGSIQSGTARPLAVTGLKRSPSLPEVPTLVELGMDVRVTSWWGVLGPAGVPELVVTRLNSDINGMLGRPDLIKVLNDQGIEPMTMSPGEFGTVLRQEFATWKDIIAEIGLRLD